MEQYILRIKDVKKRSGLACSTVYKYVSKGLWTKPIKLTSRAVGWPAHEVDKLLIARISGKSEEAIQQLVQQLEADRSIQS